ncbi:MAG TPA: alginate lyase family protein [Candidatus Eisenbacteria bacterium]|jgi:hypothetical protein
MIAPAAVRPRKVVHPGASGFRDPATADDVCAGRFTHLGITLDLGLDPDWLTAELPADKEWRREWSKFGYGRDLARAFGETNDARYVRAWERLVRSWILDVPIDHDDSFVVARRIQNWIHAWTLFTEAPGFAGFADGFTDQLLASLKDQVAHLRARVSPERNHRTLELFALFLAALALPDLDPDGDLLEFSTTALHGNLLDDILPDGVHRERSTHYHHLALRTFLGARENARRFGLELSREYDRRLELACEFALHAHRPDGAIPALSDSDSGSYAELLALAAGLLQRPDFLYSATAGAEGVPPKRRCVGFPEGGYFIQRSGWGDGPASFPEQRFLIFDCGALGDGGHGHYDLLSVEIAAQGRPLIVDPGRYTYSEEPPNWRRWFKSTAAHNTVCVDGLDQTLYQRTRPRGPVAKGTMLGRLGAPGLDLMAGVARSPEYDAVHTRWIVFVADEYWLIADDLRAGGPHRYDLRFHLAADAEGHTTVTTREVNTVVRAPGLALVFAPARPPRIEAGWVAPRYGVKLPAPVVSVAVDGVAAAGFFTAVVPVASADSAPMLRIHSDGTREPHVLEIAGVGPAGLDRDRVFWNGVRAPFELGGFRGCAAAAWVRESSTGRTRSFTACDVVEATCPALDMTILPRRRQPARWVRWDATRAHVEVAPEVAPEEP